MKNITNFLQSKSSLVNQLVQIGFVDEILFDEQIKLVSFNLEKERLFSVSNTDAIRKVIQYTDAIVLIHENTFSDDDDTEFLKKIRLEKAYLSMLANYEKSLIEKIIPPTVETHKINKL